MRRHGVFINYRREHDRYFAGRIYDYLQNRGLDPFLDVYALGQGLYNDEITSIIADTPYFLLALTPGCMDDLDPDAPSGMYYEELKTAVESKRELLLVAEEGFAFPARLPEPLETLPKRQVCTITRNMRDFFDRMAELCQDIHLDKLQGVVDWREYTQRSANVFVASREELERGVASLENRFGQEFMHSLRNGQPFEGTYRIRHINMSCYAASIIFAPERHMVDHRAYDHGMMFNIFSALLADPDFSLTLITNTPSCPAALDACETVKLGNGALEDDQQAVFLSSLFGVERLLQEEPFKSARRSKRFRHLLTDSVLPFAYFQVMYKDPWSDLDHIKLDLYTEGLESNTQRRSMMFFRRDHPADYRFLQAQFYHLQERASKNSARLLREGHDAWQEAWNRFLEMNDYEE